MTNQPRPAHVFTISSSENFVEVLAQGILDRVGDAPEKLASVRVLLPTRRACRSLREAFLRRSDGKPLLLPMMIPLGDVDEDDLALETLTFDDELNLAPAIGSLDRLTLLARLVMQMQDEMTADQAVRLAEELASLVDQVHTEGLNLANLPDLVKDRELSEHWQQTVEFLSIIGDAWPKILHAKDALDPASRRDQLMRMRAKSWAAQSPKGWIIAAGSTGSIPATAELLNVIAHLDNGALVLPGLDQDAQEQVWQDLEPSHPQFGLAQLLEKIQVRREAVQPWPASTTPDPCRERLLQHALIPATASHLWRQHALSKHDLDKALDGLNYIECPSPREEAQTIALVLREALNTPQQTAALITPDRQLARRVAIEMARWNIEVDDSAGQPLDQTPAGTFFNLVLQMAADDFHPISILAALKHPLAGGGQPPQNLRHQVRALEAVCLRGPRPGEGLNGLQERLRVFNSQADEYAHRRVLQLGLEAIGARNVLVLLQRHVQPLADALKSKQADPCAILKLHVEICEALSQTDNPADQRRLWAKDDGEALSAFAAEAHDALSNFGTIAGEQYPALIKTLMAGRAVRPLYGKHPRIFIWGLLEARLQRADVTVLGGLNEGSWPSEVNASPWMSRPMMKAFGLALPERRIGLAAHDFVQACAAPKVYLTRSKRSGTSPQVPSRWLVRLNTMLIDRDIPGDSHWLDWALKLTQPDGPSRPCRPPCPTPPVSARPRKLSVTAIEKWMRDPYAIYAARILNLQPLESIDADASAADRGNVIHNVLERFIKNNLKTLPENPLAELLAMGETIFKEEIASPSVRAFWWPRFKRIAAWFADFETTRRSQGLAPALIEEKGQIVLEGFAGNFTLTAKADRMDIDIDGGLTIMDYKTGVPPSKKQVECGLAPQLPLEGLIASRNGFSAVAKEHPLACMMYVRLTGGRIPGEQKIIDLDGRQAMVEALAGLTKLIHKFDDETTPYLSRPRPKFKSKYGDYDHLGRVKEWTGEGEGDDD